MHALAAELALAIKCLIALVLITAGIDKVQHWTEFQGVLANYRLLPGGLVRAVARGLPLIEVALGVSLFISGWSQWASWCIGVLLIVFAAAMAVNIRRGRREIDCGCYRSTIKQSLSWPLVARNCALSILVVSCGGIPAGSLGTAAAAEAAFAGIILFVVLQTLNLLWSIIPHWKRSASNSGMAS